MVPVAPEKEELLLQLQLRPGEASVLYRVVPVALAQELGTGETPL